jgi:hypothetical protein
MTWRSDMTAAGVGHRVMRTPERAEQAAIVRLLRTLRAEVYVLGTTRRRGDYPGTMQTAGLPDLVLFLPPQSAGGRWRQVWCEVKAIDGRLSPAQRAFRGHCGDAGVDYIYGSLTAVIDWLAAQGYVRAARGPAPSRDRGSL